MDKRGIYSAGRLRDHWKRMHKLSLNTCRMSRVEPRYYYAGEAAHQLEVAGRYRRAIELLPQFAHPVPGFCHLYLTVPEWEALKAEVGL